MGARKPIVNDPLSEYMAKPAAPAKGLGQVDVTGAPSLTLSSGAISTTPTQAGTVSTGTVMPTSRPRTKFTVLTPQ
jgi:hypothetical protein